jgi:hypothetical protein
MRCRLSPSRYINTHSASGARRNRLSMVNILPWPPRTADRQHGGQGRGARDGPWTPGPRFRGGGSEEPMMHFGRRYCQVVVVGVVVLLLLLLLF